MGASSSTDHGASNVSAEQQEQESLAASTVSLPLLQTAFSKLSPSSTITSASLQEAFSICITSLASESVPVPPQLSELLNHLGESIASLFFVSSPEGDGVDWVQFLRGYNRCCARTQVSRSVNALLRLYSVACRGAGIPCGLEFDPGSCVGNDDDEGKIGGSLVPTELLILLWLCWIMGRCSNVKTTGKGEKEEGLVLPDVRELVLSALVSSGTVPDDGDIWKCEVLGVDKSVPGQKVQMWILTMAPELANRLSKYVQERLLSYTVSEDGVGSSTLSGDDTTTDACLLTHGRAWAVSLVLRDRLGEEFLKASFKGMDIENLIYRSSVDGKGLSRFWSNIEGYNGPLMILVSAYTSEDDIIKKWVIGVLTGQGLENKDTFFGNSGYLFAISPIFRVLPPSGRERNFSYCHLRPATRVYEPNPKPVGLAFGGSTANERIFLDEDFAQITVRHHAVDKTYQHGSLIPNQGFLPIQASVAEVEVWGCGGSTAKRQQDAYKRRENIFSEQRRKVDLKTFGSWEDSPEKMMMDMVSDPNKVRREDR